MLYSTIYRIVYFGEICINTHESHNDRNERTNNLSHAVVKHNFDSYIKFEALEVFASSVSVTALNRFQWQH